MLLLKLFVVWRLQGNFSDELEQSDRCLLDCLCQDEMKCCKSMAKVTTELDRDSTVLLTANECSTSPNEQTTMVDADDEGDNVRSVDGIYSSLPNIVPRYELSSDDSRRSLRTKPSDSIDYSMFQVPYAETSHW